MDDKKPDEKVPPFGPGMEGEGNKTADRAYRQGASAYAQRDEVEAEAQRAEREVDADPETYARAVAEGKSHSKGELKRDLRGAASSGPSGTPGKKIPE